MKHPHYLLVILLVCFVLHGELDAREDRATIIEQMMYGLSWGDDEAQVRARLEAAKYVCLGATPMPIEGRDGIWLMFEGAYYFSRPEMWELEAAILQQCRAADYSEFFNSYVTLVACLLDGELISFEVRFITVPYFFLEPALVEALGKSERLSEPIDEMPSYLVNIYHRFWRSDKTLLLLTSTNPSALLDSSSLLFADPGGLLHLRDAIPPQSSVSNDERLEAYKAHVEELLRKANSSRPSGDAISYSLTQQTRSAIFPWEKRQISGGVGVKPVDADFIYAHIEDHEVIKTKTDFVNAVFGGGGDDIIIAGAGFGATFGSSGNDTYFWRVGDGDLYIADTTARITAPGHPPSNERDENVLLFGDGISPEDVGVSQSYRGITFTYLPTGEQICVLEWYSGLIYSDDSALIVRFTDGTTWMPEDVYKELRY